MKKVEDIMTALETMARSIPGCRSVDNKTIVRPRLLSHYGAA